MAAGLLRLLKFWSSCCCDAGDATEAKAEKADAPPEDCRNELDGEPAAPRSEAAGKVEVTAIRAILQLS